MLQSLERYILYSIVLVGAVHQVFFITYNQRQALDVPKYVAGSHRDAYSQSEPLPFLSINDTFGPDWKSADGTFQFIENSDEMRKINKLNMRNHEHDAKQVWRSGNVFRLLVKNEHGGQREFAELLKVFGSEIQCPSMRRVGGLDENGQWVCGIGTFLNMANCVVYIVGTNESPNLSHGLYEKSNCEIHVFDPFISSEAKEKFRHVPNRVYYHEFTIGISKEPQFVFDGENGAEEIKEISLRKAMNELGHSWIDVLSVIVDGSTWDWFSSSNTAADLPASQVLLKVECGSRIRGLTYMLGHLAYQQFRIFHMELNMKEVRPWESISFSFARMDMDGTFQLRGNS